MTTAFELSDLVVSDACALDPLLSTHLGIAGSDHKWGAGFGLEGVEEEHRLVESYRLRVAPLVDSTDTRERVAALVMSASFHESNLAYEAGDHFRDLRHIASPFHEIRSIFDVMAVATEANVRDIVARLESVSQPLSAYQSRLEAGTRASITVASRQVRSVIAQARRLAVDPASFDLIVERVARAGHDPSAVSAASGNARSALSAFADWLENKYLVHATDRDGVGRESYIRSSNRLVGLEVDPDEAYEWGWAEFRRLWSEMERAADEILPGEGVETVRHHLETEPALTATGTEALIGFVERTLARAIDDLAGSHFDVPELIRPITVQLAPPGSPLGVYYVGPSEDFARPGGVWYSIGGQTTFPLYQHVSTAYHEGFPGHHLQTATAMSRFDEISRFQRVMTWYPGYDEGWGMYAEVLMGELGYLDNPQHRFGMLAKQLYRASRVLVDIGLHLDKAIDSSSPIEPGSRWTFPVAVAFMETYGFRTPDQARDEVLRYLGWPGQAIAYKLGEREILRIREETRDRLGPLFDLKEFHSAVLKNGSMRFDLLEEVVREHLDG